MKVSQIIGSKGRAVITVSADVTLQEAASVLDENRIGATVAVDTENRLVGVLSERDVVRYVARDGTKALSMKVHDAMTRGVITASMSESVDVCMERMTDRRIRHLPVMEEGRLVGIVSIGDLVKWKIAETEAEAEAMKAYIATG